MKSREQLIVEVVKAALAEDAAHSDITTKLLVESRNTRKNSWNNLRAGCRKRGFQGSGSDDSLFTRDSRRGSCKGEFHRSKNLRSSQGDSFGRESCIEFSRSLIWNSYFDIPFRGSSSWDRHIDSRYEKNYPGAEIPGEGSCDSWGR